MSQQHTPRISIIMVDGAFRPSYHAIDFFCNQTFPQDDFELLWVEYTDTVNPALAETVARYPNARVITLGRTDAYHPSYCFNAGIREARGQLLVIPDGDQACEADLLQQVWDEHQTNEKLVMYLFRYEEPEDQHVEPITLDTLDHLRGVCFMRSPSNFGACLTVRKKWLLAINGYDQHRVFHTGFHSAGRDVNVRFKNLGLHIMWHPTIKLYHSWHPFTKAPEQFLYGRQMLVIDWHAVRLETLPYDGLDPACNLLCAPELEQKILDFEARHAASEASAPPNGAASVGVKALLRRVIGQPRGGA